MPHRHFEQLREKIHDRLRILRPPYWKEQIERYPWLYGALGDPGANAISIPSGRVTRFIAETSGSVRCCATSG